MSSEALEARFLLLESHVKKLEEKNLELERQLKEQVKLRETDLVRFISTSNQLKARLKAQLRDREANEQALDQKIHRKQRKGRQKMSQ